MHVFFISFTIFLYTLFPSVAPYRDAGEMVSVGHTLGVAHPPGYPLYSLVSKAAINLIPFGNAAYRLNAASALFSALSVWVLYMLFSRYLFTFLLSRKSVKMLSFLLAMIFATSYLQWYLSLVSEMYTLNILFAAILIYIVFKFNECNEEECIYNFPLIFLFLFVFAIGLGNRLDLLFLGIGLSYVFLPATKKLNKNKLITMALFFALGFSVYIYLLIRSSHGAFLDWNHPANLSRLWATLSRKTHGGTLDLISKGYVSGENFMAGIKFYFNHLMLGFAYLGIPAGLLGLYSFWKTRRNIAAATFIAWFLSGPLFIYISNIPPNTHALAILEAHFLLPNLIFFIWVAEGFVYLYFINQDKKSEYIVNSFCAVLLIVNLGNNFNDLNKRNNFITDDYVTNIFRSVPGNGTVVIKEDVQLFSMWNAQIVNKKRKNTVIISQGLSGSSWYQDKWEKKYGNIKITHLGSESEWKEFVDNNSRYVYVSHDSDFTRIKGYNHTPQGLVTLVTPGKQEFKSGFLMKNIYVYRQNYKYDAYKEFFTPDIIEEYAKGAFAGGQYLFSDKKIDKSIEYFKRALSYKEIFPVASNFLSYSLFALEDYKSALKSYLNASLIYEKHYNLAVRYNTPGNVKSEIKREWSDVLISGGVCAEKAGNDDLSIVLYDKAVKINPSQPRAYFNKAVVYWKRQEWQKVILELEQALYIDPNYEQALYYLSQARGKIKDERQIP